MVIPKTNFGLPGQNAGLVRRRTMRATAKRTTSYPLNNSQPGAQQQVVGANEGTYCTCTSTFLSCTQVFIEDSFRVMHISKCTNANMANSNHSRQRRSDLWSQNKCDSQWSNSLLRALAGSPFKKDRKCWCVCNLNDLFLPRLAFNLETTAQFHNFDSFRDFFLEKFRKANFEYGAAETKY